MTITVESTTDQITIDPDRILGYRGTEDSEGSKGKANVPALQKIFMGSPLIGYSPGKIKTSDGEEVDMSSAKNYRQWFIDNVTKGTVNGVAYGLGSNWSLDYENAAGPPNLSDVETGGEGLPATPFVPNPMSPGEGSVSPSKQAAAPPSFVEKQTPSGWPDGAGVAKAGQGKEADPSRNPVNTTVVIKNKLLS